MVRENNTAKDLVLWRDKQIISNHMDIYTHKENSVSISMYKHKQENL